MRFPLLATSLIIVITSSALAVPEPDAIVPYKKVGDVELSLHIFNPAGHSKDDRKPAIVFFFGGGWVGGTPKQFYNQSEYLASRGMVAMCADYRTRSRHKTTPRECVQDGKSAIRWVRAHAASLGIDPDRLAAGGGSAGGHVAAATATVKGLDEPGEDTSVDCRPDALVLFNPVFDNGPDGYGHDRVRDYWKEISPLHNVDEDAPPTTIFLGTNDKLIPVDTAREYKRRMNAVGAHCDLHLYAGMPHGFFNRARFTETLFEADRFLTSLGYLRGEPTLEKEATPDEEPIPEAIAATGITGGLILHLDCGDGKKTVEMLIGDRFLVNGLDTDEAEVRKAREHLRARGLHERVAADVFDGRHLPYVDNLVNLVVAEAGRKVPLKEILRVLVPGGVALVGTSKITKPWPEAIDEWTHFLHGPDNNAVAEDTVVAAPKSIQWVSHPKWSRSHEEMASVSGVVSAKGKIFFVSDEAPLVSIRYLGDWKLVARDAFNGTLLWKRTIPTWSDHLRHFRAGPVHLPRRLVAVDDRVYITMGLDAPVSVLDAATGKTLKVLEGTERTEEILVEDGIVYLVVGTSEVYREGAGGTAGPGLSTRGEPAPSGFRFIAAVDSESGKTLWKKDFSGDSFLLPTTLTVRKGRLYYQDTRGVGQLDAKTGRELWKTERATVARRMSFSAPTVVATDDVLLCADRVPGRKAKDAPADAATNKVEWGVHGWNLTGYPRRNPTVLIAYSTKDGKELWSLPCKENYNAAVDLFVVGDQVYVGTQWQAYDLRTGEPAEEILSRNRKVGMAHHRCYRNKASVNYLFTGRSGIEVVDLEKGWVVNNSWLRGTCQYGIMPANGLLYAPPDACGCFNKVKVQGMFAAAPKRKYAEAADRLEKGPAYGRPVDSPESAGQAAGSWPTYRHDGARSGSTGISLPASVQRSWTAKLSGRLTQPVAVDDTVYVAEVDGRTLHALNMETGETRWLHTAGGRIDSSPTLYRGLVLFGSADGRVTCLRAEDGQLVWRFLAARCALQIMSYGQPESLWPVHGSVLVQNGRLYFSAGRNSYLDDGIVFYELDPLTGRELNRKCLYHFDPETGAQLTDEAGFDMEGVNTDLLSGDGENVFMKQVRLSASLEPGEKNVAHLFGIHGFLGEEWFVRSYWLMGTNVRAGWGGWASAGGETTFGRILCHDDKHVYGYGRTTIQSGATGHRQDSYHLFGVNKVLKQTGLTRRGREKRVAKPPTPFWSRKDSLIVRAMVLAGDKLVVAGPRDAREKESHLLSYKDNTAALASFRGEKGIFLRILSASDGSTLSESRLTAMPAFDGMSAAYARLFISTRNGTVECWSGR